jgi:hypothetical protein
MIKLIIIVARCPLINAYIPLFMTLPPTNVDKEKMTIIINADNTYIKELYAFIDIASIGLLRTPITA